MRRARFRRSERLRQVACMFCTPTVSQTTAPRYQYQPDLKSAEGQIESVNAWTRRMTVDGEDFDLPDSFAMTNVPAVGQEVMVTYYVAQDGRNIVRSIDHSSAR